MAGSATTASAATCYDSATHHEKPASKDTNYMPWVGNGYFVTSSNCSDINIRANGAFQVKVCFYGVPGGNYCQSGYKWTDAGDWRTIATNVADNVKYKFYFRSAADNTVTGWVAD